MKQLMQCDVIGNHEQAQGRDANQNLYDRTHGSDLVHLSSITCVFLNTQPLYGTVQDYLAIVLKQHYICDE